MNWIDLERHFSPARLGRYRSARGGDTDKAAIDYTNNLLLAEAMMPMLNVLEIALRNAIHTRLSIVYKRNDWWELWVNDPNFKTQSKQIEYAKSNLDYRGELQTPDKVLAELTFGFWSSLFNARHQLDLWKDLRLVFPRCPKNQRQRQHISTSLNQVRKLRNRVFHHESLIWLTPSLLERHTVGIKVIGWLDPNLAQWLSSRDRLTNVWGLWLTTHD